MQFPCILVIFIYLQCCGSFLNLHEYILKKKKEENFPCSKNIPQPRASFRLLGCTGSKFIFHLCFDASLLLLQ